MGRWMMDGRTDGCEGISYIGAESKLPAEAQLCFRDERSEVCALGALPEAQGHHC